jgi:hypothetical protein
MKPALFACCCLVPALPAQFLQISTGFGPPAGPELVVYDPGRDRSVAILGDNSAFPGAVAWEHDGLGWSPVVTTPQPAARVQPAMVHDGSRVLLYGGATPFGTAGGAYSDFWAYDGTWNSLSPVGPTPGPRAWAAMAHDPLRNRVVLFGGTDQLGNFPGDTWEWDGATWTQVNLVGPSPRVWHRMVYDEARQRVVLCGGALNPAFFDDTWEWDGLNWINTVNGGFPICSQPALVFDRSTQRTLMFRGSTNLGVNIPGEIYAYDPPNGSWTPVATASQLPFGTAVTGCYDATRERTLLLPEPGYYPGAPMATTLYYRDQGTAVASYSAFGSGCAGAGGQVPQLSAAPGSTPAAGSTFTAQVGSLGNSSTVLMGIGWSRAIWNGIPLPMTLAPLGLPGCDLLVAPDTTWLMNMQGSVATLSWPIPNQAGLAGLVFFAQALVLDATAGNGIGALSNGAIGIVQ